LKEEPDAGGVEVKTEPGTQALVITADIYRMFLEKNTGFGKTPINARDERDFHRILKAQFNQALAPYKTPLNTYPFDEKIANSVFIARWVITWKRLVAGYQTKTKLNGKKRLRHG
jgi:hypothetical protein